MGAAPPITGALALFLSVAVLAILALIWGAWWMAFRQGNKQKGVLMLVAALVLAGNVAIWTV